MNKPPLRIIGVPIDLGAGHRGVDMGPSAIRITHLQDRLIALGYAVHDWGDIRTSVYESIDDSTTEHNMKHATTVLAASESLAQVVRNTFDAGEMPLVLGGDHSLAIGSIAGAAQFFSGRQEEIGVLWVDAHADMNTPETSPSGNIHGMSLAIALGIGDEKFTSLGNPGAKIKPEHVALVGARDLDAGEVTLLKQHGIRVFTTREIDERGMPAVIADAIAITSKASAGIYVNFDMDSIDPSIAPGTGTPVAGGLTYREAHLVMEMLHDSRRVIGVDLVETNPALDERNRTAEVATGMLLSLFGKRIMMS